MNARQDRSAGRVLIVEDEMMVSMLLEDMLEDLGYDTVGLATQLDEALELAKSAQVAVAILDVNLNGQETYAVADILKQRNVPFIFATGYGAAEIAERFGDAPTLQKPFQRHDLDRAIAKALQ